MNHDPKRRLGLFGAVSIFLLVFLACSPQERYKTLQFFFDGVPTLPGRTEEGVKVVKPTPPPKRVVKTDIDLTSMTLGSLPSLKGSEGFSRRRLIGGEGFSHQKMPRDKCLVCHTEENGLQPKMEMSQKFCDPCHGEERRTKQWNHGVINFGQCGPCHEGGHSGKHNPLLANFVSETCLFCHDENKEQEMPIHKMGGLRMDINDCTACHDPHKTN